MIKQLRLLHIHPLFWVMMGTAVMTGYFYDLMLLFTIILLHELGHAAAALHYEWKIRKISLLPFGGMMETDEYGTRPLREEAVVAASGPLVHLPLAALSYFLQGAAFWGSADHALFMHYNISLFCFNLLPIHPLDGGRLLFCLYARHIPFYLAQKKTLLTSGAVLGVCIILAAVYIPLHMQAWLIASFFIMVHIKEWKQLTYRFYRFLIKKTGEPLSAYPREYRHISWQRRPVDAAKLIRRHGVSFFYIVENGQTLSESFILETITKKRKGMETLKHIVSSNGKDEKRHSRYDRYSFKYIDNGTKSSTSGKWQGH
ncbi:M50 family metallopeptidase [Salibacterium halotolerans]|uniref:M50 family metallopeptidase n=1 Tax=Salibacterium halotolerans TaxID=1884432 RepID=UPI000B86B96C|nr:M50 family metallopeptidase [Salibacterium halotolerans]